VCNVLLFRPTHAQYIKIKPVSYTFPYIYII